MIVLLNPDQHVQVPKRLAGFRLSEGAGGPRDCRLSNSFLTLFAASLTYWTFFAWVPMPSQALLQRGKKPNGLMMLSEEIGECFSGEFWKRAARLVRKADVRFGSLADMIGSMKRRQLYT